MFLSINASNKVRNLFVVVYHYKIPIEKTIQYITLEKKAIDIYLKNGCIAVEIFRDVEKPEKWMEINRFEDREHYETVAATLREDKNISELYKEFNELLGNEEYETEKKLYLQMI